MIENPLTIGQTLLMIVAQRTVTVTRKVKTGGMGTVYQLDAPSGVAALMWFHQDTIQNYPDLIARLDELIRIGAPSDAFAWPYDRAVDSQGRAYGYVMPWIDTDRFNNLDDFYEDHARFLSISHRSRLNAAYQMAEAFERLHAVGKCFMSLSLGDLLLDSEKGEILISGWDKVTTDGLDGGVIGAEGFIAPEVRLGKNPPNSNSDRHSMAVLLFRLLCFDDPLLGELYHNLPCPTDEDYLRLYGSHPLFLFDPDDPSNAPDPNSQRLVLMLWSVWPTRIRELFAQAFTKGLSDPRNGRVMEVSWKQALVDARDSIFSCEACGVENILDPAILNATGGEPGRCINGRCRHELSRPPCLQIREKSTKSRMGLIAIEPSRLLYPHHLNPMSRWDFTIPQAEVVAHPQRQERLGLLNRSKDPWRARRADGDIKRIEPGEVAPLTDDLVIDFGSSEGRARF